VLTAGGTIVVREAHDIAPQAQSRELVAGLDGSGGGGSLSCRRAGKQPVPDDLDKTAFGIALLGEPPKVVRGLAGLIGHGKAFLPLKAYDLVVVPRKQPVDGIPQIDQELGVRIVVLPGFESRLEVDLSAENLGQGADLGLNRVGDNVLLHGEFRALVFGFLDHDPNRAPTRLSDVYKLPRFGTEL